MSRFSVAGRSSIAGTNLRGQWSLFATAAIALKVREIGAFNTTSTALAIALVRFTNTTGQGAGLTEAEWDILAPAQAGTAFAGHTADAGIGDVIRQASIGAAIGAGIIWTFGGDSGLVVPAATTNGIGIIIPTGTGQICDFYCDWDE